MPTTTKWDTTGLGSRPNKVIVWTVNRIKMIWYTSQWWEFYHLIWHAKPCIWSTRNIIYENCTTDENVIVSKFWNKGHFLVCNLRSEGEIITSGIGEIIMGGNMHSASTSHCPQMQRFSMKSSNSFFGEGGRWQSSHTLRLWRPQQNW